MIRARQRFLEAGHFADLATRVHQLAREQLQGVAQQDPDRLPTALEVGSGSGYYIGEFARSMQQTDHAACFLGLDVSKHAARLAARFYPEVFFFVNDLRHRITVADGSVDVILDIFSPRHPQEFSRIARPGALLLVVIPTAQHLVELREHLPILNIEPGKRDRAISGLTERFELIGEEQLSGEMELEGFQIADILRMTPNAWHLTEVQLARTAEMTRQRVSRSFEILSFRRREV